MKEVKIYKKFEILYTYCFANILYKTIRHTKQMSINLVSNQGRRNCGACLSFANGGGGGGQSEPFRF